MPSSQVKDSFPAVAQKAVIEAGQRRLAEVGQHGHLGIWLTFEEVAVKEWGEEAV